MVSALYLVLNELLVLCTSCLFLLSCLVAVFGYIMPEGRRWPSKGHVLFGGNCGLLILVFMALSFAVSALL